MQKLREHPDLGSVGKEHLAARTFQVFISERLGARFAQPVNFISDLEKLIPHFYAEVGANLSAWIKPAPKLMPERSVAEDVSPKAIEADALNELE